MKTGLFFDTETTGLPVWREPSGSENQPHIVQLGAILADSDTQKLLQTMDVIVKPDGWEIPQETIDIHGITNEQALDVGIPEKEALTIYIDMLSKADLRIAHNTTFDNRIIRIALKRYFPDLISDEVWKCKDNYYCTLINFRKLIGGKSGHTLSEAYKYFTGKDLENAHNAMVDTKACMEIYWGLKSA
jgi:DNA polymerase-3 subunit epsilon